MYLIDGCVIPGFEKMKKNHCDGDIFEHMLKNIFITVIFQLYFELWLLKSHDFLISLLNRRIQPHIKKNKEREKSNATFTLVTGQNLNNNNNKDGHSKADQMDNIMDIREYDVPYHVRVSIDLKINVVRVSENDS